MIANTITYSAIIVCLAATFAAIQVLSDAF